MDEQITPQNNAADTSSAEQDATAQSEQTLDDVAASPPQTAAPSPHWPTESTAAPSLAPTTPMHATSDESQPQTGQLQTGQLQTGQPQTGQLQTGQPYGSQAPASGSYAGQSYPSQPYGGQSDSGQSDSGQSDSGQSDSGQSYSGQSYPGQPYAGRPYAGQSYAGQPAPGQPFAGQHAGPAFARPAYPISRQTETLHPVSDPSKPQATGPQPGGPGRATRSRRRRTGVAALAIAGCLVAGSAGGALGAEWVDNNNSVAATRSVGTASASQASIVNGTVQAAAAKIMPSTVVIEVTNGQEGGTGSGIILDTDGDIVTNNHVVSEISGGTIQVTLSDGRTAPATIVGTDPSSDLAVIKIDGISGLQPATFADSDALVIGQTVVAVGAPLGLSGTVTEGIVSAVDRPVRTGDSADSSTVLDAVQTDAAINPGNSGGPLVNLAGEVVGINSAIASVGQTSGQSGNIGVGFAIPSDDVTNTADQLMANGTAVHASLGISASEPRTAEPGALVQKVNADSGAAKGGLQAGDLITELDDRTIVDLDSLLAAVRDHEPGDTVTLTVERNGAEQTVSVVLGSRTG